MRVPLRLFPQTATLKIRTGTDKYGRPVTKSVDSPARIDTGERIVRNEGGTEETARVTVRFPGDVSVNDASSVILPDFGERPVIGFKKISGSRDIAYSEVYTS